MGWPDVGLEDGVAMNHRWVLTFPVLSRIDHAPGLYAVYIDGELVYVGQSVNLHLRFRRWGFCRRNHNGEHCTPWGLFAAGRLKIKVAYSRKYGDWAMRELRLVRRLKPRFNTIQYAGRESVRG